MVTFNMNKRKNTVLEFQAYVQKKRPMVLALQEHGCTEGEFQIHVPGYHTVSIAREEGKQSRGGLCTVIHNGLVSCELASIGGCDTHPCFLPVRLLDVFGEQRSCIFINVYVPGYKSSHEDTVDRNVLFLCLCRWLVRCSQKFPHDAVIVAGDFNMDAESAAKKMVKTLRDLRGNMVAVELQRACTKWIEELTVLDNKLGFTRMGNHRTSRTSPVRMSATCIDHFVVNAVARRLLARIAETDLTLSISDHFPVVAECWTRDSLLQDGMALRDRRVTKRVDIKKISRDNTIRESIIHDNRWAVLAQCDDHDLVKEFPKTTHGVLESKGCMRVRGAFSGQKQNQDSVWLSRETTRAIREVNSFTKSVVDKYRRLGRYDGYQRDSLELHNLKRRKDALLKKDNERKWSKEMSRITGALCNGDLRRVFREIKKHLAPWVLSSPCTKLKDADGVVYTDRANICRIQQAHYSSLATDSKDPWEEPEMLQQNGGEQQQERMALINEPFTWGELNSALHSLNKNKAAGVDGIQNEVLELCRTKRGDEHPDSTMGKALLKFCNAVYEGHVTEMLHTSIVVSIPKSGKDPTEVTNHRGISLICTPLKLVTKMLASRVQDLMLDETLDIVNSCQAGFRRFEECSGQVASLMEIVARRRHEGKDTYVAFLDLTKAYDSVKHPALIHCLRKKGFHGRFLDFVSTLYANGKICVDGTPLEEASDLEVGIKQGDSISPVLFTMLLDNSLDDIKGVQVNLDGNPLRIPGLLLADDTCLLAETREEMETCLGKFGDWCDKWGLKVGHAKSGIMCALNPRVHTTLGQHTFVCQQGEIPVVDQYKYLGLILDHQFSLDTIIKGRVAQGRKALALLQPLLCSHRFHPQVKKMVVETFLVPQLLYGAECYAGAVSKMKRLEQVFTDALLCIARSKPSKGSQNRSTVRKSALVQEMGVDCLTARALARRVRAWYKFAKLNTWVRELTRTVSGAAKSWTWQTRQVLNMVEEARRRESSAADSPAPGTQEGPVLRLYGHAQVPMDDTITAFFDGAKNEFGAGLGVVLWYGEKKIAEVSGYLGPLATHNEAEYAALVEALRTTYHLGGRNIRIYGDSQTIINMASGQYRARSQKMRTFQEAVFKFRSVFREISLEWIPREQNAEADTLAKEATRSHCRLWTMRELEEDLRDEITLFGAVLVQPQQDRTTIDGKEAAKEAQRLLHRKQLGKEMFPLSRQLTASYVKRSLRLKDASRWPTNYVLRARMNGFAELLYRSIHADSAWTKLPQCKAINSRYGYCASCGQVGYKDTIAHLLVECPHHAEARERFLGEWQEKLQQWWRRHGVQPETLSTTTVANAHLGILPPEMGATLQKAFPRQWLHHTNSEKAPYAQVNRFLRLILAKHMPKVRDLVNTIRRATRRENDETRTFLEDIAGRAFREAESVREEQERALLSRHGCCTNLAIADTIINGEDCLETTPGQATAPELNVQVIRENFTPHDRGPGG